MTLHKKYTSLLDAALNANADAAVESMGNVYSTDLVLARKVRADAEAALNAFVLELINKINKLEDTIEGVIEQARYK